MFVETPLLMLITLLADLADPALTPLLRRLLPEVYLLSLPQLCKQLVGHNLWPSWLGLLSLNHEFPVVLPSKSSHNFEVLAKPVIARLMTGQRENSLERRQLVYKALIRGS
jgi:hypothetical protein